MPTKYIAIISSAGQDVAAEEAKRVFDKSKYVGFGLRFVVAGPVRPAMFLGGDNFICGQTTLDSFAQPKSS